ILDRDSTLFFRQSSQVAQLVGSTVRTRNAPGLGSNKTATFQLCRHTKGCLYPGGKRIFNKLLVFLCRLTVWNRHATTEFFDLIGVLKIAIGRRSAHGLADDVFGHYLGTKEKSRDAGHLSLLL